jgi:hypothetical protein
MKHLLLTTLATVLLVGCGPSVDIWEAAATGNIEAVKQHLAAGWDVDAEDNYESSPLQFAAQGGHKKIVELLIAGGADVNANEDGSSPLHIAANREIAELLITNGADVNANKVYGETPLDSARFHTEIADLLRKHGGKTGEELKAAGKPTEPVAEAAQPEPPTAKTAAASQPSPVTQLKMASDSSAACASLRVPNGK